MGAGMGAGMRAGLGAGMGAGMRAGLGAGMAQHMCAQSYLLSFTILPRRYSVQNCLQDTHCITMALC
eukprot:1137333-Pelagomonas_calceolata.AAC.12